MFSRPCQKIVKRQPKAEKCKTTCKKLHLLRCSYAKEREVKTERVLPKRTIDVGKRTKNKGFWQNDRIESHIRAGFVCIDDNLWEL